MKAWKKITVSVLTAAVFILAIVHVYNRLEEIWTLELSDISDTFKIEDAEMGNILESDGNLILTMPEPAPFTILFYSPENTEVMRMVFTEDGKLDVKGNFTEGARIFFEEMVVPMANDYIYRKLQEKK